MNSNVTLYIQIRKLAETPVTSGKIGNLSVGRICTLGLKRSRATVIQQKPSDENGKISKHRDFNEVIWAGVTPGLIQNGRRMRIVSEEQD